MKKLLLLFSVVLLFASCARRYRDIPPASFNYENKKAINDDINVYYKYNIQEFAKNKPYVRKERNANLKMVAIKIENKGDSTIQLREENFIITTNTGSVVRLVPTEIYVKKVRQYSEAFLIFYGLAGIGSVTEKTSTSSSTSLTYSPFPLLIGLGNAIFSYSSNDKQYKYLKENSIFDTPIPPNATIYGLITIQQNETNELNFSYSSNSFAK